MSSLKKKINNNPNSLLNNSRKVLRVLKNTREFLTANEQQQKDIAKTITTETENINLSIKVDLKLEFILFSQLKVPVLKSIEKN